MNATKEPILAGNLNKYGFAQADNVWSVDGICPCIITGGNRIGHQINILEENHARLPDTVGEKGG